MSTKYHPARPWAGSPYRRRRTFLPLALAALAGVLYIWAYGVPDFLSLSPALKDIGFGFSPGSSRAGRVAQALPQLAGEGANADVRELDALLHFLVSHPERQLDEDGGTIRVDGLGSVAVDGTQPVDLRVYAPDGDYAWEEHTRRIREQYPLVVFSKTYCPYSIRAKALLASYNLSPAPKIIEVNMRSDGPQVQSILARLTGRATVPNILLKGAPIGGSDDLHRLHEEHRLQKMFEEAGLEVKPVKTETRTQPQRRNYRLA
ncbi:glutaredoxin [Trametes polyzona]|nr:glutaredoxin [Trametes polyzona]